MRRLLLAQVPADLADWLDFVALGALLAFSWGRGPAALAALTLALALPYVVLGPFIGVLIDRADLRRVLVASNLGRAAATAAFAVAPDLPTLLVLALLKSSADALFTPAKQAALPLLAPADRLMAANGLSHTINQLAKIAGPALGGLLVAMMPLQPIFLINAGLSLVAAALLLGLPRHLRPSAGQAPAIGFRRQLVEGLVHFRARPVLLAALAGLALGYFFIFLYDGLIVLLVRQLGFSQATFGLAIAAVGAGGILGALLLGQFAERRDPLLLMAAGGIGSGLLMATTGHAGNGDLTLSAAGFALLLFATGVANAALFVPYRTVQQRETPPPLMGRVTTVAEAVTALATLAGPPLGAALAQVAGLAAPFLAGGYLLALLGLALAIGRLRHRSPPDAS